MDINKFIFFVALLLFCGCDEVKNKKNNLEVVRKEEVKSDLKNIEIDDNNNSLNNSDEQEEKYEYKPDWSNPFMSPYGKPIINIIRAYFMVGEFQVVKKFIVNSDCFDDYEFEYLLRNCSWGYEIDATNMKWQNDSTFLMTAKSMKNQTVGMEQYLGKLVNDTAKIFLFGQNKDNPFIFDRKYPSAEIQCQIESLAKTIDFEYDSSNLTEESRINLKKLYKLVSRYSNLSLIVNGHTSSEGSYDYNMKLSLDRAKAVRSYLIALGINNSKINFNGFGSTSPIYSNTNTELRSKNRRVEISILN